MPQTTSHFAHTRRALQRAAVLILLSLVAYRGAAAQSSPAADAPADMSRMIGLSVAASGGPRDTLGLLIATVTRDGPADRAGITTGSRILAVNGLQVRLAPADIGRRAAADSALLKFDRALRVTPPGRDVMLRVAGGGLTRLVNVPVAERSSSATTASAAIRAPASASATDAAAPSDTNGERSTGAPWVSAQPKSAQPASALPPTTMPVPTPRIELATDPVSITAMPASPVTSVLTAAPLSRSVGSIADALGEMQLELRRLSRESRSIAMSDSLADLDVAMGALRRRMRAIAPDVLPTATRTESATTHAPMAATNPPTVAVTPVSSTPVTAAPVIAAKIPGVAAATRIAVPGLDLAKVSGELAAYLGAQADSALSVIRASEAWEPMRAGDVIVLVDGAAPDQERLRSALETHRRISVTLLRRGRSFTVLLGEADVR
jgi:PDZ domain